MRFGQLVIGPPGSGKTTFCNVMSEFLRKIGRNVAVINLDPANDVLPFKPDVDVSGLITVEDVMENLKLGPNGGLIYSMEYLEKNFDWLLEEVNKYKDSYLLFDCPGQVELYTHHKSLHNVVVRLQKEADIRLAALHLVDSHYCSDPGKFISVLLTSLATMLQTFMVGEVHLATSNLIGISFLWFLIWPNNLRVHVPIVELPHINVLSKCDMIEKYGKLHFNLDFYTEVLNLSHLTEQLSDDPFLSRYKKLNESLVGVVEDYSLVSFMTLNINSKESMYRVLQAADKANGYVFGSKEENRNIQAMLSCAMGADFEYTKTADIREKYIDSENVSVHSAR